MAFHGLTNASGFAGLACNELLVHGWDASRGLGIEFSGYDRVSARVLHRIYPEVEYGNTPWAALLSSRRLPDDWCGWFVRPSAQPNRTGRHGSPAD